MPPRGIRALAGTTRALGLWPPAGTGQNLEGTPRLHGGLGANEFIHRAVIARPENGAL